MDPFLLTLKNFFLQISKTIYKQFIEFIIANIVPNIHEIKVKKEAFKFIDSDTNIYNSFILLTLILI